MKQTILLSALLATLLPVGCEVENLQSPTSAPVSIDNWPTSNPSQSPVDTDSLGDNLLSDNDLVQQDVRTMSNAVYQSKVDVALSYTHPKIIEMMGGTEQAKATLASAFSQFESLDMKLESLEFPDTPTFLKTEMNRFVIVPTKSIMSSNGNRVESLNFQFGILENGTNSWKYIEGSRINQQNVRSLFPDFPTDYDFPEFYRKKL